MTNKIFEVIDKSGRKIHLSKERLSHIRKDHPDVENHYDIEDTIKNPINIRYLKKSKIVFYKYFKHRKDPAKYLKVIVRYLNGSGFIITAYFVKTIRK